MTEWTSVVRISIGALLIVGAISIVLTIVNIGSTLGASATQTASDETAAMNRAVLDGYDQQTVRGTAILSAVQYFAYEPLAIVVKTKSGAVQYFGTYLNPGSLTLHLPGMNYYDYSHNLDLNIYNRWDSRANNPSDYYWINPAATYSSMLIYKYDTGALLGIYFAQSE